MKNKKLTKSEALEMYIRGEWYLIMPFDHSIEKTYIQCLKEIGFVIVEEGEGVK